MDAELLHICEVLDLGKRCCGNLLGWGINSFNVLQQSKGELSRREIDGVTGHDQGGLYSAICWFEDFESCHGRAANILQDSSEEALNEYIKQKEINIAKSKEDEATLVSLYIKCVLGSNYSESNTDMYSTLVTSRSKELHHRMVAKCTDLIMNQHLQERCGKFDYKDFARSMIEHFNDIALTPEADLKKKTFIVAGKTQSGKSSVKGVIQSFCGMLNIPLIVLTKGVPESRDLHAKLEDLSQGTRVREKRIVCGANTKGIAKNVKQYLVDQVFKKDDRGWGSGTLVIADTPYQINRAIKAVEKYRAGDKSKMFMLVVDECDAFYRTKDKRQKTEQAYDQLIKMSPALTVMISATPIPMILEFITNEKHGFKSDELVFSTIEPIDDYVGIDQIRPLEVHDEAVYLEQNEISLKSTHDDVNQQHNESEEEVTLLPISIPYTNSKVVQLYDDALSSGDRKGVLLLDCTCPRVNARGNVFEKAEGVQKMYHQRGKPIVVITYVGKGVFVKTENSSAWERKEQLTISSVLQGIDDDPNYGLEVPIFIFGFTKMRRGISYRSSKRVPTHMIVSLGRGHNIMNVVQTMGRATFNGRSVLEQNGFKHVTILTTHTDFTMALKTQEFIEEVSRRYKAGGNFVDAVTGTNSQPEMPDAANFLRHTFREIGTLKGQRRDTKDVLNFSNVITDLTIGEEVTKKKYWNNAVAQRLLRAILNLDHGDFPIFLPDDLVHGYNEMYLDDGYSITKTAVKKFLRKFVDNALISKDSTVHKLVEDHSYTINNNRGWFLLFIREGGPAMTNEELEEGEKLHEILTQDCEVSLSTGEGEDASQTSNNHDVHSDSTDDNLVREDTSQTGNNHGVLESDSTSDDESEGNERGNENEEKAFGVVYPQVLTCLSFAVEQTAPDQSSERKNISTINVIADLDLLSQDHDADTSLSVSSLGNMDNEGVPDATSVAMEMNNNADGDASINPDLSSKYNVLSRKRNRDNENYDKTHLRQKKSTFLQQASGSHIMYDSPGGNSNSTITSTTETQTDTDDLQKSASAGPYQPISRTSTLDLNLQESTFSGSDTSCSISSSYSDDESFVEPLKRARPENINNPTRETKRRSMPTNFFHIEFSQSSP